MSATRRFRVEGQDGNAAVVCRRERSEEDHGYVRVLHGRSDRRGCVWRGPLCRYFGLRRVSAARRSVIDFNNAYNPNCARSAHFTCPVAIDNIPVGDDGRANGIRIWRTEWRSANHPRRNRFKEMRETDRAKAKRAALKALRKARLAAERSGVETVGLGRRVSRLSRGPVEKLMAAHSATPKKALRSLALHSPDREGQRDCGQSERQKSPENSVWSVTHRNNVATICR